MAGNPFSTLEASRNYSHGVIRGGSARNIGATNNAGQVEGFRPGETSPGAFALKMASTIMGTGQRLAARKQAQDQADQDHYARQLQIARMEQGLDPNYMSRYQRGEEYDREHPVARPTPARATIHLSAAQATRYGVGKAEGDYDPDLIAAERGQRGLDARKLATAHAAHIAGLNGTLNAAEKSIRDRVKSEGAAAVEHERKQADEYLAGANAGDPASLKGLGISMGGWGNLSPGAQKATIKTAYERQMKLVQDHAESGVRDKYQPQLDKITNARLDLIRMGAAGAGIDWEDDDKEAPPAPAQPTTRPTPTGHPLPAGLAPTTDPRTVVGLGPGNPNAALNGAQRPLAPSAQQFINGLNQFGGAPVTQPQHADADEGAGAGYPQ